MSFGLNTSFTNNVANFLANHAVTTAMLSAVQYTPPGGVSTRWDFLRSDATGDVGVSLLHVPGVGATTMTDQAIRAYWLPQGGYINVPMALPQATYIFTPELSGCKIYVDYMAATNDF